MEKGLPWWLSGKESACQAGNAGSIPGSGRSPGEGNGSPLHYSCQENPMDSGAWRAAVYGVTKESGMTWRLNSNKMEKTPVNGRICRTVIMGSPRLNLDPGIRLTHDPGQR